MSFSRSPLPSDSYCFEPVQIHVNGLAYYVPCGKCDGCLLHRANSWSVRVGDEIEHCPAPLFFTLTYSNKYVPKYRPVRFNNYYRYYPTLDNIRFDGSKDVRRQDMDFFDSSYIPDAPINNYPDSSVVAIHSKRDIQLWLKLIRKRLYEDYNISRDSFRYYIVSEYGPGKVAHKGRLRPHYHGIMFCQDKEVAEILRTSVLYESWQMCDRSRFDDYCKYCDSGTRSYVAPYITGVNRFSPFYEEKEVKPFRLSSKSPSIGFSSFDRKKVQESIVDGVDEYTRTVSRIGRNYILRYPSQITSYLFPKCARFSVLSDYGLCSVYGYLYYRQDTSYFDTICNRLRKRNVLEYTCARRCLDFCNLYEVIPDVYVQILKDFYYRRSQHALKRFYEDISSLSIIEQLSKYDNILDVLDEYIFNYGYFRHFQYSKLKSYRIVNFLLPILGNLDAVDNLDRVKEIRSQISLLKSKNDEYRANVHDILNNMDKSRKANALSGIAPE